MTCVLCNADLGSATVISEKARGVPSRRVVCATCGLVQVSPQPSEPIIVAEDSLRIPGRDVPVDTVEYRDIVEHRNAARSALVERLFGSADTLVHCALHKAADPIAALQGADRVLVEVPDVDAYVGDRDGYHYRADHLYDFSATTLVSTLLRAGYGDVHVMAHDGLLTAWGSVHGETVLCDDVDGRVAALRSTALTTVPPDDTPLLERWLAGEALAALGADEHALRTELAGLRGVYAAMLSAWEDAVRSLGSTRDAWSRASRTQIEHMTTDAFLNGAAFGRGVAYDQAAKAVSHIVHRMGRLSGAYR